MQLVRGPLSLRANGKLSERAYMGDTLPLMVQFEDANGQTLNIANTTLTGRLTQFGATLVDDIEPADTYDAVGLFRLNVDLTDAEAGVCRLTVRRDAGAGDVQTAEILIQVESR